MVMYDKSCPSLLSGIFGGKKMYMFHIKNKSCMRFYCEILRGQTGDCLIIDLRSAYSLGKIL
jgi:hypothetical protein